MDNVRRPIRHANEFFDYYGVSVHEGMQQKGDLIIFSRNGLFPTHIGIVKDEKSYIHAPGRDGTRVSVEALSSAALAKVGRSKQIYKVNPIGFKSPTIGLKAPTYRYHQQVIQ